MTQYPLTYGIRNQLKFTDHSELFYSIGFLTKANIFELKWENNELQGAWASEGRIHVYAVPGNYPTSLKQKHTAGNRGGILHRINCNEFLQLLWKLGFIRNSRIQNLNDIVPNIPDQYKKDFEAGRLA